MKHRIDRAALEEKSEELEIPFSNLLAGYVLESLMYLITESEFWKYLWLKTGSLLGVDKYNRDSIPTLEFAYVADEDAESEKKPVPEKIVFKNRLYGTCFCSKRRKSAWNSVARQSFLW